MSEPRPHLSVDVPSAPVRGIAIVLHGGRARGHGLVTARQLAVVRMLPFARALRRAGARDGLLVARLRYRFRGWNGAEQSPVADARWALDQLAAQYSGVPIALVGHSMGARAALYVADHPAVSVIVGLAPWLEQGDPVDTVTDRRVLLAHGTRDRMTSAKASAHYAAAAASRAASVSYISVQSEAHAMLRRAQVWHDLAAGYVVGALFGVAPRGTADGDTTNVLAQALAGEASLVV